MTTIKCGRTECMRNTNYRCTRSEVLLHPVAMRVSPEPVPAWLMDKVYCIHYASKQSVTVFEKPTKPKPKTTRFKKVEE